MLASAAWAQSPPLSDAEFVMKASVGNTFEMQEAKLALDHATDTRLRAFAQKMISDHGDAEKKLHEAAKGMKAPMTLDRPHQAMLDNLKTMSGENFEKIYTADQVQAHAETVALCPTTSRTARTRI